VSDVDELIREVEQGPSGAKVAAFFDFDGTLIAGYSALAFFEQGIRSLQISAGQLARSIVASVEMNVRGTDVSKLMMIAIDAWEGRAEDELEELGERLYIQRIAGMVYPEARALVRAHKRKGHTVALASSATRFQAAPLARDLGIEDVLVTPIEVVKGVVTGRLSGPILWGEGKKNAVLEFARKRKIALEESYAYGNGDEDVPFLEAVGRPRPLNPQSGLERVARERGWPVRRFSPRGRPGLEQIVRTGLALASFPTLATVGAGVALLNGDRRLGANWTIGAGSDLLLALAGVKLNVEGEEHLWSHRPAVFIFNHQSAVDAPVVGALLRRDLTAVAKKELARDPRMVPINFLVQPALIDRGNTQQAKKALEPVVAKLREGYSIAIAPEGTRSPTPKLGRFKKGAFHMAMQGGVPIVPIVIRNAGEIMWKGSYFIRPGTIDVEVLPPIPTDDWKMEEIGRRVDDVRRQFLEVLERWEADRAGERVDGAKSAEGRGSARGRSATRSGRESPRPAQAR
jgi:putative phosphoserine phosphatase/1-acylglycerol-3-phosphate O-acyltransferase